MKAELALYRGKVSALDKFCKENSLEYTIFRNQYPLKMLVRPNQGYYQLSILENVSEPVNVNATLCFTMECGEAHYKIDDGFSIGESMFNKLKSLFKDIANFYAQYYFRVATTEPGLAAEAQRIMAAIDAEDE